MTIADDRTTNFDVIVIGGGGAGLAAAIEARTRGASVLLMEKNTVLGGTTAWSIGSFTATQTPHQISAKIDDNPDLHFEDMPKFAGKDANRDNPALRRIFVDNASETVGWLMSLGVEFFGPMPEPPHTRPRMHNVLPNSHAYIRLLGRHAKKVGIDIQYSLRARRFILDSGRVSGVEATGREGIKKFGGKSIVLATGDYAANAQLKEKYISEEVARVDAMNPTATGDGHEMAFPLGARVLNGDILSGPNLRFLPPPKETLARRIPPFKLLTKLMKLGLQYAPGWLLRPFVLRFTTTSMAPEINFFQQGALLVNKHGQRIDGPVAKLGLKTAEQPDKIGYVIMDSDLAKLYGSWPYFIATAPGIAYAYFDDFKRTRPDLFHKASNIAALATNLSMPVDVLTQSIREHNAGGTTHKIYTPPFYSLGPAKSYIVLTDGGLAVNQDLQLLDSDDQPISGLWAAGSVGQGGLLLKGHGHHIGWAFTSGRIAGQNAASAATNHT